MNPIHLYWTTFETPLGEAALAVTSTGIFRFDLPGKTINCFSEDLQQRYPQAKVVHDGDAASDAAGELEQYWTQGRTDFTVDVDVQGTEFQQSVWRFLREIPYGQTVTYGQVAEAVGSPKAYQAVGRAVGANPVPIMIPCHRVIGADGSLTGFASGIDTKRWLLEHEGCLPSVDS